MAVRVPELLDAAFVVDNMLPHQVELGVHLLREGSALRNLQRLNFWADIRERLLHKVAVHGSLSPGAHDMIMERGHLVIEVLT